MLLSPYISPSYALFTTASMCLGNARDNKCALNRIFDSIGTSQDVKLPLNTALLAFLSQPGILSITVPGSNFLQPILNGVNPDGAENALRNRNIITSGITIIISSYSAGIELNEYRGVSPTSYVLAG